MDDFEDDPSLEYTDDFDDDAMTQALQDSGDESSSDDMEKSEAESVTSTDEDQVVVGNFSPKEKEILLDAQQKIKALERRRDRPRLVKEAETTILSLPENKKLKRQEREDLQSKTRRWLAAHAQVKKTRKSVHHWSGRAVMYQQDPEAVLAKQTKLYQRAIDKGKRPKSEFDFFQLALSDIWDKKLTEDEREAYRLTAIQWNNEGPEPAIKSRLAEKHAYKKIAGFAQDMYISMGVRFLFFVSFKKENGKIACTEFDFNDTLGRGKSYLTANPQFHTAGVNRSDWTEHNRTYYEENKERPAITSYRPRKGIMELKKNMYGEPILPDPEVLPKGLKRRPYLQNLLRTFLALHYELASGEPPQIPWSKFIPVARSCIDSDILSDELVALLKEPSELREGDAMTILKHVYGRQEETDVDVEPAFRFSQYVTKRDQTLQSAAERRIMVQPLSLERDILSRSNQRNPASKARHREARVKKVAKGRKKSTKSNEDHQQSPQPERLLRRPPRRVIIESDEEESAGGEQTNVDDKDNYEVEPEFEGASGDVSPGATSGKPNLALASLETPKEL